MQYYIVDVFAESKYTGNQLAVFWGDKVRSLSDQQMLQIAREINYSETTFILSQTVENGGYPVRIFTPKQELPFAGHPTLGTAYIIQNKIIHQPPNPIILNLKVGKIPVRFEEDKNLGEILWMEQNPPIFGQKFEPEKIASLLNLETKDLDSRFPIQEVSTGIPFMIVPLKTQQALKKATVNVEQLWSLIEHTEAKCILIFCPETYHPDNQLSVRMFGHYLGIPEDPATGSANGCLAGYLTHYSYFNSSPMMVRVEQGYEIDRPSLLLLKSSKEGDLIKISVGGKVLLIAQGVFL